MVFQDFNLFPHMTVLENCIEAPVRVRKVPRQHAIDLAEKFLDKVHLLEKRDEYPARLSGGQKH
jgi:polar amino acid transport system ATP-binding protein